MLSSNSDASIAMIPRSEPSSSLVGRWYVSIASYEWEEWRGSEDRRQATDAAPLDESKVLLALEKTDELEGLIRSGVVLCRDGELVVVERGWELNAHTPCPVIIDLG